MDLPADLLEKVERVQRKYKTLLIGIDGLGGSGKTTLSETLKENLGDVTIVQLDDFYSPELNRVDRDRVLEQVLLPLENDAAARYQIFDWRSNALKDWRAIEPGGIVIIEGVSALHSDFAEKYDFRIWIHCPPEAGFKRGVARDKARDSVDNTDKWLNVWMPQEKEYVESQRPQLRADYILDGTACSKMVEGGGQDA
jgi:uridine kinase